MNDLSIVNMFHSQTYLSKPVQNLRLCDRPSTLFFDPALQVTPYKKIKKLD